MTHILDLLRTRQERPLHHQKFQDLQFSSKKTLNSLDLKAHFGCVNALSFSNCGTYLASGGDDRRILIWDVSQALDQRPKSRKIMKATHESNIFCIDFDCGNRKLFSGGNDEKLLIHDLKTGEILDIYPHDEPVYCVCAHPESPELLTTACSDGRVQLIDLRAKNVSKFVFISLYYFVVCGSCQLHLFLDWVCIINTKICILEKKIYIH